jgi:CelD/BcsL family acetyltransferase involved in cellulose biosynthesis
MRLEVITDTAGLVRIGPAWQALAELCSTATVFQTYEWNAVWWRHFGRVVGRRLYLLVWREDGDEQIVGLAPLMSGWWHGLPLRRFSFLGAGAADYHDILALPGKEQAVADAFYAALRGKVLDISQLCEHGLLRAHLPPQAAASNVRDADQEACPYLPLAEDWETVLRGFGKKTRSNIGYYERGIRKVFEVEIGQVTEPDRLDEEMSRLFALHQRRWNQRWLPGVFGSRKVQAFHRDLARTLLDAGTLRLFTLKLDGETQAALYCFASGDRMCYYQAGFEPTYAKWSLGTVLTAHAIQTAVSEGRAVFDFLRGDEPYKAKWTQQAAMNIRRLVAPPSTPSGALARRLFSSELHMERRVKAWMRRKK